MGNLIVILVILAIVAAASLKLIGDKKNGVKCSGCPYSPSSDSKNACSLNQVASCSGNVNDKK